MHSEKMCTLVQVRLHWAWQLWPSPRVWHARGIVTWWPSMKFYHSGSWRPPKGSGNMHPSPQDFLLQFSCSSSLAEITPERGRLDWHNLRWGAPGRNWVGGGGGQPHLQIGGLLQPPLYQLASSPGSLGLGTRLLYQLQDNQFVEAN